LDEVLELLDKTAKRYQKNAEETQEKVSKLSTLYEEFQQSAQATQEQKLKTFVKKTIQLDRIRATKFPAKPPVYPTDIRL